MNDDELVQNNFHTWFPSYRQYNVIERCEQSNSSRLEPHLQPRLLIAPNKNCIDYITSVQKKVIPRIRIKLYQVFTLYHN